MSTETITTAQPAPCTYSSGTRYWLARCDACRVGLNSGHHYLTEAAALKECHRHNSATHG